MKKKPIKVEEPAGAYVAKKTAVPVQPVVKQSTEKAFQEAAGKIFSERKELLRKLAQ